MPKPEQEEVSDSVAGASFMLNLGKIQTWRIQATEPPAHKITVQIIRNSLQDENPYIYKAP